MKFYEWLGVYNRGITTNHVFGLFGTPNHFISLCNKSFGAMGGENKSGIYCGICGELAFFAEEKAQQKENDRVAKQELMRESITAEINSILSKMSMDEVNKVHFRLKSKG